jgi:Skp family chaperone for outer membrane proteins
MRRFTVAVVLSLALGAVPTFALAQAAPTTPPAAAAQNPPTTPPAQQPPAAAQNPATPPAPAIKPFPPDAKIAFVNIPRIAAESAEGKASTARVNALRDKKLAELNLKNKQVETAQQKLTGGGLLSEEARAATQKEIDKLQVEIQRLQQDAESEMQDLQQQLQMDFQRKLTPVIQQIAAARQLHMILPDSGLVWADLGLDLTGEIIKAFDAATAAAAKGPAK